MVRPKMLFDVKLNSMPLMTVIDPNQYVSRVVSLSSNMVLLLSGASRLAYLRSLTLFVCHVARLYSPPSSSSLSMAFIWRRWSMVTTMWSRVSIDEPVWGGPVYASAV